MLRHRPRERLARRRSRCHGLAVESKFSSSASAVKNFSAGQPADEFGDEAIFQEVCRLRRRSPVSRCLKNKFPGRRDRDGCVRYRPMLELLASAAEDADDLPLVPAHLTLGPAVFDLYVATVDVAHAPAGTRVRRSPIDQATRCQRTQSPASLPAAPALRAAMSLPRHRAA
jgi:hypothetical protein